MSATMEPTNEKLAAAVQAYKVLYDKSNPLYKDKVATENAWRKVAVDAELPDVKTAKRLFDNLKKRYQKNKKAFKAGSVSGSSKTKVSRLRKKLNEFSYMFWIDKYYDTRESKSNINLNAFKEMAQKEAEKEESSTDEENSGEDEASEGESEETELEDDVRESDEKSDINQNSGDEGYTNGK